MGRTPPDYDPLAWFYDRHWGGGFSSTMFPVVRRFVLQDLGPGAAVLDLCCGTGNLAGLLSQQGFRVTGIDASEAMLLHARTNAPGAKFLGADVRSFHVDDPFPAAVSTYDSLNHMLTPEDLRAAFRCVHAALAPRGIFLFDMNMDDGFRQRWRGSFGLVEPDGVCVVGASYDSDRGVGRMVVTMFRPEEDLWRRTDVTLVERCYPEETVRGLLQGAGFDEVKALDAQTAMGPEGDVGRTIFVARRSKA